MPIDYTPPSPSGCWTSRIARPIWRTWAPSAGAVAIRDHLLAAPVDYGYSGRESAVMR